MELRKPFSSIQATAMMAAYLISTLAYTFSSTLYQHWCVCRLASSNFMQILNAPSREEVDKAHSKASWLVIGVSSVGNVFRVSRLKSCCWVALLLTSVPIHLLFNSAVFETDFRESDFHLTIATKEFTNDGAYFPPGASLLLPGYGFPVYVSDYYSHERSDTFQNISEIAADSGRWNKLEPSDCKEVYLDCSGLKKYRDVVLIVNHEGWIRDEMWSMQPYDATFWNPYVPSRERNHLFFDSQCMMYASFNVTGEATCVNLCSKAMGSASLIYGSLQNTDWNYSFQSDSVLDQINNAVHDAYWHPISFNNVLNEGLNLSVDHCLGQPLESTCRVGVSPILLLVVTICVIGKTSMAILATALLSRQDKTPLVTVGDAMASFIEKPESVTSVYCTFGQAEIRKAMASDSALVLSKARKWEAVPKLSILALPGHVWITSYLLCFVGIGVCTSLFASAYQTHGFRPEYKCWFPVVTRTQGTGTRPDLGQGLGQPPRAGELHIPIREAARASGSEGSQAADPDEAIHIA
ncbi:hypothetical protein CHU98_g1795 [Xylaria longipes]|nr:hypothetical protein CHU98_g1795 [Xylaria longipes]